MEPCISKQAEERIRQMEACFDELQEAVNRNPAAIAEDASLQTRFQCLIRYYESGYWLHDYELDENGLLSQELKRGVLSQDAVFDFLERMKENG